jgi:hypothetical protein
MFPPDSGPADSFGFTLSFWAGLISGFILGIAASYIGNYLWEKHKKRARGSRPFMNINISEERTEFEGQIPGSKTTVDMVLSTLKATISPYSKELPPSGEN